MLCFSKLSSIITWKNDPDNKNTTIWILLPRTTLDKVIILGRNLLINIRAFKLYVTQLRLLKGNFTVSSMSGLPFCKKVHSNKSEIHFTSQCNLNILSVTLIRVSTIFKDNTETADLHNLFN